jgi:predicted RNA binding protein YcfA (HicA-like mRNA interferase family)
MKVRDAIDLIEDDGWFLIATRGSHRQDRHLLKPGRVTMAGKPSDDLAPGTFASIFETCWPEGMTLMRYGCDRTGRGQLFGLCPGPARLRGDWRHRQGCRDRDPRRYSFPIDGLKEDGLPMTAPTSIADYVEA